MRDSENIQEIASLRPDYMGFIFYEKSDRFVGNSFHIPKDFPKEIKRVGVFVNENVNTILKIVSRHQLDFAQLHGNESVNECKLLKEQEVGVIKVFSVDQSFDFGTTKQYAPYSDYFLFDTKTTGYGGSGKSFDWGLLENYDQQTPFFLSGGLSDDNLLQVLKIENKRLYAVDVNSRVETSPGLKDVHKVKSIKTVLATNN